MPYKYISLHILGELTSVLLLSLIICVFTVPLIFSFILALILIIYLHFFEVDRIASVIVTLTLALTLLILEAIITTLPADFAPQYYRPDEVLVQTGEKKHDPRYKANQSILNFNMKRGDLDALSPYKKLAEPRVVDFITDNLGHRNVSPYDRQDYIVFGDSFVVGSGSSQESTISEFLTRDHLLPTYNAGFPGEPHIYINKVKEMQSVAGSSFKGVMLFFEGNDFRCENDYKSLKSVSKLELVLTYVPEVVQKLDIYRLFFGLTRRALYLVASQPVSNDVLIYNIVNPVAFLKGYKKETERTEPCWTWSRIVDPLKEVSSSIQLIVFVPDKSRVYHNFIRDSEVSLPKTQSNFLRGVASELGIKYLT